MRVLVTGHDGYIGSVLAPALQLAGHEVWGLDTFYYRDPGREGGAPPSGIPSIVRDVRDVAAQDLAGFNAVIHLAALCNDPLGDLNLKWTYEINHQASVRLARLARDAGVNRFVFASSCSVYGDAGTDRELTEDTAPQPLTAYARSKAKAEEDIAKLADSEFSPVFMRNGSVFGNSPQVRADIVLNNLVCWAVTTGKVRISSDGTPWRPLVHVEDVTEAFRLVLVGPRAIVHNQIFNVGAAGNNYQVHQLAAIVRAAIPGSIVEYVGHNGGDPRDYRVDFTRFQRAFPSFRPRWTVMAGVQEVAAALLEARVTVEEFQGPRYTRLSRLKELIATESVDPDLRMKRSIVRAL